jgi:hypothetical protein
MTNALNQLAVEDLQWIWHRKVVDILKVPHPTTLSDIRPFSMLEVPYNRFSYVLPAIIGNHQHGFMAWQGIQDRFN